MSRLFTKSQAAFILTANKLFEVYPKVYFWTFTFKECMPDWWYPRHWDLFNKALQNLHGGWLPGVRVIEVHPGGHGLHYHALLGVRLNIHLAVRVGKRYGIGQFMDPKQADIGSVMYLAKYLTKKEELYKGMRRWGCMGGFVPVRVRDIEVESVFADNMREIGRGKKVSFTLTSGVLSRTKVYGRVSQWPAGVRSELELSDGIAPINRPKLVFEKKRSSN